MCGNEAMQLAKRLNEELANKSNSSSRNRSLSPEPDTRGKNSNESPRNIRSGKLTVKKFKKKSRVIIIQVKL